MPQLHAHGKRAQSHGLGTVGIQCAGSCQQRTCCAAVRVTLLVSTSCSSYLSNGESRSRKVLQDYRQLCCHKLWQLERGAQPE